MSRHGQRQRQNEAFRLSASGRLRRMARLGAVGVSVGVAILVPEATAATNFGSAAWFDQAGTGASQARSAAATSGAALTQGALTPATPADARIHADRSLRNLANAISTLNSAVAAQQAAASQALSLPSTVRDGLGAGGLQISSEAARHQGDASGCSLNGDCAWVNVSLPTEAVGGGQHDVTIKQNAGKAILTWNSFNVGRHTTLHIDQSDGTQKDGQNNWVALNQVVAGTAPSQILGMIKAEGAVYVLNQNGVLFDSGSQVNVHSLVASSLPLYLSRDATALRDDDPAHRVASFQQFLGNGLASVRTDDPNGIALGLGPDQSISVAGAGALAAALPGDVRLNPGATIRVGPDGYALIAAPNVNNAGWINATDSQVAVAAGLGVGLSLPTSGNGRFDIAVSGRVVDSVKGGDLTPASQILNTGLITSTRGSVILQGARIDQAGVIEATTSVSRLGSVELRAQDTVGGNVRLGSLRLESGSLTAVLPDDASDSTNSSPTASQLFQPLGVTLSGGAVTLESGALVEAPGHHVVVNALVQNAGAINALLPGEVAGRAYLAPGAVIDVSGLADVQAALSSVLINVPRLGLNELADSPLQRSGPLFGSAVTVDSRISGTRADGVQWIGTPLANLGGYVQQVSRSVRQLLTNAGSIDLSGREVIARSGSQLNLSGGFTHYLGGYLTTTHLLAANGAVVDISAADPNVRYIGFAGDSVVDQPRWNISTRYQNPLIASMLNRVLETDDVYGGTAGTLTIKGISAAVVASDVDAHAVFGRFQTQHSTQPTGGTVVFSGSTDPISAAGPSFVVTNADPESYLPAGFGESSKLLVRGSDFSNRGDLGWWTPVGATVLAESGVGHLRIVADSPGALNLGGEVAVNPDVQLSVAPRGSIELSGSRVTVSGALTAPAGAISIVATGQTAIQGTTTQAAGAASGDYVRGDIVLDPGAVLDAGGLFVNDAGAGQQDSVGAGYLNGGSIALATYQASHASLSGKIIASTDDNGDPVTETVFDVLDLTGSIRLNAGSRVSANSGAYVTPAGQLLQQNNVIAGRGGDISLQSYVYRDAPFGRSDSLALPFSYDSKGIPQSALPSDAGKLLLDGSLSSFGFSSGGKLTLRAPDLQIGGAAAPATSGTLSLAPSFFSSHGFGGFDLAAEYDATIAAGTDVVVLQVNLLPAVLGDAKPALLSAADGAALFDGSGGLTGLVTLGSLDKFHRQPVNLSLHAGDYLTWGQRDPNDANLITPPNLSASGISGTLLLDVGGRISGDAGAQIALQSINQLTVLGAITAHGGEVVLSVDTAGGGYAQNSGFLQNGTAYSSAGKSIWLGPASRIDVSGTTVVDETDASATGLAPGRVLDGGKVTITADSGYVIAVDCNDVGCATTPSTKAAPLRASPKSSSAITPKFSENGGGSGGSGGNGTGSGQPGAGGIVIDVSGTEGTVGVLDPQTRLPQATSIASNAGSITIGAANGLYFHGHLSGNAGGANAEGGTLRIAPEVGKLQNANQLTPAAKLLDVNALPAALPDGAKTPGGLVTTGTPDGVLQFSASILTGSGITSLSLGTDPSLNTAAAPVPIAFTSSVTLNLGRELEINTLHLNAAPPAPKTASQKPDVLKISLGAPYVSLHGYIPGAVYNDTSNWPSARIDNDVFGLNPNGNLWTDVARASLSINSGVLDIGGHVALDYYASVSLNASGEVRFITPPAYNEIAVGGGKYLNVPSILQVSADLTVQAPRVYPATGNSAFVIVDNAYQYEAPTGQKDEFGSPITKSVLVPSTATVTFSGGGGTTPYSIGGRLLVDAVSIKQNGSLYAPDGQIILGVTTDPNNDANAFTLTQYPTGPTGVDYALPLSDPSASRNDGSTQDALLRTGSVEFGSNSVTSVSLNGLILPYAKTLDGLNPVYNGSGVNGASATTLDQAPAKGIIANGAKVSVDKGAVVDLRGGGDLLSSEWVAGTGGSRDVLSQFNVSYAGGSPSKVPLYADGRPIYAILPGYQGVAPFDPEFSSDPLIGKSVYLSGMPGLPNGNYVLLPAQYALLPGAFRIVQDTRPVAQDALASLSNSVLADGTLQIAGYFSNTLSGARQAHTTTFLVQDQSTWRQYSEYNLTSLNSYFAQQSARQATTLRAPGDGGSLSLAVASLVKLDPAAQKGTDLQNTSIVSPSLTLAGTIEAFTPQGLNGAALEFAAPLLQVSSGDAKPLSGYVQLDADTLNGFGASRIVLGATTSDQLGIETFNVQARKVDVSTFGSALKAGEIVLVTQTPAAGDGIFVEGGAKLQAVGQATHRDGLPISIPSQIDPLTGLPVDSVLADGAFLQLSMNNANAPSRDAVPGTAHGAISVGAGASLIAPGSITFDATSVVAIRPDVQLQTGWLLANSGQIRVVSSDGDSTNSTSLLVGPGLQTQLAAIDRVTLNSASSLQFDDGTSLAAHSILELNAGEFTVSSGAARLLASIVRLANAQSAATTAPEDGSGTLAVVAGTVQFGAAGSTADFAFSKISQVKIEAADAVLAAGSGSVQLGRADLLLETPQVLADSGADLKFITSGALHADSGASDSPAALPQVFGGRLSFEARAIDWNTRLGAPSGALRLIADNGNVNLGSQAVLSAAGDVKQIFDAGVTLPGGQVELGAVQGDVLLQAGSLVDVSAGGDGVPAGRVMLAAQNGKVVLDGALGGVATTAGQGGRFSVDSGAGVDLDRLAGQLGIGGFDREIDVHVGQGDLRLSAGHTLVARQITLTADSGAAGGGKVTVDGNIDASGKDGGTVLVYGARGVALNGSIFAYANADQGRGGYVELGVGAQGDGTQGARGEEHFLASGAGVLQLGSNASIDVSAGVGADASGKLVLRVPLLADGTVPLRGADFLQVLGTSSPVVEAYARWVAREDDSAATGPYFDGVLDPAGSTGGAAGAARASFVVNTLGEFIANPGWNLALPDGWQGRAGIELVNGNRSINDGAITLASTWNLAAGQIDADGNPELSLRTEGVAPAITLRAVGDIRINASLTDGFFQTVNPFSDQPFDDLDNSISPIASASNPLPIATAALLGRQNNADSSPYDSSSFRLVAGADLASAAPLAISRDASGSVIISGEQTGDSPTNPGQKFILPTVVRTGVGRIDIAAAGDLRLTDTQAPGAIYTAGYADVVGAAPVDSSLPEVDVGRLPTLLAPQAQPMGAGDITVHVAGNITGIIRIVDADAGHLSDPTDPASPEAGVRSGFQGTDLSQYWWPWMQDACISTSLGCGVTDQSSINFGMFAQGLLSTGGNVDVSAGGSIRDFSVSLPTTWRLDSTGAAVTVGGGSLRLAAGDDILGGAYFVARGTAQIEAGRDIAPATDGGAQGQSRPTLLALQDAQFDVSAGRRVNIGGVFNPSYLFQGFDSQAYSTASAVNILGKGDSVLFGSLPGTPGQNYDSNSAAGISSPLDVGLPDLLPASLSIAAPNGSLSVQRAGELFPSPLGQLSLIAAGDVRLVNRPRSPVNREYLGLIDAPVNLLPSVTNPVSAANFGQSFIVSGSRSNLLLHSPEPLHGADTQPLRIYSEQGSIINGDDAQNLVGLETLRSYAGSVRITSDKPAEIRAGEDIVNLSFTGQNLYSSDITTISAGRDLYDPPLLPAQQVPVIELGGPGTLVIEAGRDIGPLTSANSALALGYLPKNDPQYPSLRTVGNGNNFYLPREGASIVVRFGDGPGINVDGFASRYIDPSVAHDPLDPTDPIGTPDYAAKLVSFVQQYVNDQALRAGESKPAALSPSDAWDLFQQLPLDQRKLLAGAVFVDILNQVGLDYNGVKRTVIDTAHPDGVQYDSSNIRFVGKYGRGYQAIDDLFPAQSGYTDNVLDGSRNGAVTQRETGTFDMRGTTVQTQAGGDITLLGPGGRVLVGSASAPPFVAATATTAAVGPNTQGVITLESGAVRIFSDQSVLLAQSRIFTEQGGDLLIWSSNGDINAGKGAKTSSEIPPLRFNCDDDLFCLVDARSQVSGAGIAVLQSKIGEPVGSANLVAPVGTVDAGDAGIRVAGNLNVAALHVANADNIQVQGSKSGIPSGLINTGALSIANAVESAVAQSADQADEERKRRRQADLELFVDVLVPPEESSGH